MLRRKFIQRTTSGLLVLGLGSFPNELFASNNTTKLTILHTNDVHSRIDPFPLDGGKYQGLGGAAKRATLIDRIRKEEENVLLFDCGDILQGTPYFNFYEGSLEFELMNKMKYDAATIGNHDFDAGIEKLSEHIDNSNFQMLNCNYNLSNTPLKNNVKNYKIFDIQNVKIGVLGVGIKLDGLVPKNLYGDAEYLDPIKNANETASLLKNEFKCDLVICLSHLGYEYESDRPSDLKLAKSSNSIDLILGGHTHTCLDVPTSVANKNGEEVLVNQVGWAGIRLGRLDYYFTKTKKRKKVVPKSTNVR